MLRWLLVGCALVGCALVGCDLVGCDRAGTPAPASIVPASIVPASVVPASVVSRRQAPPTPTAEPAPLAPGALGETPWTYFETTLPVIACGLLGDEARLSICETHTVGDPRRYEVALVDGTPHLWRRDGDATDTQALVFDVPLEAARGVTELVVGADTTTDEVLVAGVADGDVRVLRVRSDTGAVLDAATFRAGDGEHRATGVQLARRDGELLMFVRAVRPWMALATIASLALVDRADAGVALAELDSGRDHAWARAASHASVVEGGARFEATGRRLTGPGWSTSIDDVFHCSAVALTAWRGELVLAQHCPATSGADLRFYDRASGTEVAVLHPGTIGSIGHSAYRSTVDLAIDGDRAYLRGDESGGRYLAIVDLAAHRTLAVQIARE